MSQIRKYHTGYYGVAMAVSVIFYLGLGIGYVSVPHRMISSESYTLVGHLLPIREWGPVYIVLGLGLFLSARVSKIPHIWVRIFAALGLVVSAFWLVCFIASAFFDHLTAYTFIPLFGLAVGTEYRVVIEPERQAQRSASR